MNDQSQSQPQPESKPELRVCRCGVALVSPRARKTGLCIVCMEVELQKTLKKVAVPPALKWQN